MQTDRKKKLAFNTVTSIAYQLVTVVSGLILPRLFLSGYGSNINGLYHSISKFLSMITLLEFGIGAVIQSALYKPLAENDSYKLNCIMTSGTRFYRRLALVLSAYIVVLAVGFGISMNGEYYWAFTVLLVLAVSIGSFARYLFGAVDQILLNAAQSGYIFYSAQIITLIVNLIVAAILIGIGAPIYVVVFVSSLVYLVRPLAVRLYIKKHYTINRREKYDVEPITQKWNGMAQHFSYVVLEETDTIVLTLFSTLANVSVYGVYNSIVMGIKQLINGFTKGAQSLMGDMIARKEKEKLVSFFGAVEYALHSFTVLLFSCVGVLIVPFVTVYTKGINDANYIQPVFGAVLVIAYALHTMRTPYSLAILAAGHYKQTQSCYIVAAVMNLVISIAAVSFFGLIGVSIGTLAAMTYQTIWMLLYTSKNIIR